jgi:putative acetyltransferase
MSLTVSIEPPRQPQVLDLLRQSDDLAFSLYPADSCYLLDVTELEADNVAVFVARDDGAQVDVAVAGIAALVSRGDNSAELKRLFVSPTARGRGVADAILRTLEEHAATSGVEVLQLETGPLQPAAIALYLKRGYRHIPRFGPYVDDELSVCMEKTLA